MLGQDLGKRHSGACDSNLIIHFESGTRVRSVPGEIMFVQYSVHGMNAVYTEIMNVVIKVDIRNCKC